MDKKALASVLRDWAEQLEEIRTQLDALDENILAMEFIDDNGVTSADKSSGLRLIANGIRNMAESLAPAG